MEKISFQNAVIPSMDKPKPATLEEVLGQHSAKNEDAEVIGELLYAIQKTEYFITVIIAVWSVPIVFRRLDYMLDNLLMRIPWQDKIKFAREMELLTSKEVGQLQCIFQDRNFLAHPRSNSNKIINKFPSKERHRILSFLGNINLKLQVKMDQIRDEVVKERNAIKEFRN